MKIGRIVPSNYADVVTVEIEVDGTLYHCFVLKGQIMKGGGGDAILPDALMLNAKRISRSPTLPEIEVPEAFIAQLAERFGI